VGGPHRLDGGRDVTEPEAPQLGRGRLLRHVYTFRASEQAVHPATRLQGFADAILAIAATVLVLQLTVVEDRPGQRLSSQVYSQRAALVCVLLGFIWIAGAWVLSHRALRQLRGVDHYMTLLVLASTLSITLIPFAIQLLARGYGHDDFWVGVEAVCLVVLIGTVLSALGTDYAHRHGLLSTAASPEQRHAALTIWWVVTSLVVLAVLLAPWVPWLAFAIVVFTRISALLPLYSDRVGTPGNTDPSR
jgi:uncharacterized membrane protein